MLIENFLIDFSLSQLKGGVFYLKNSDVNMRNIPANQATSGGEGGFIYFLKGKELYWNPHLPTVFLIHEYLMPYNHDFINKLKSISYISTICSAAFAIMASSKSIDETQRFVFVGLSVGSTLTFYFLWGMRFIRVKRSKPGNKKKNSKLSKISSAKNDISNSPDLLKQKTEPIQNTIQDSDSDCNDKVVD